MTEIVDYILSIPEYLLDSGNNKSNGSNKDNKSNGSNKGNEDSNNAIYFDYANTTRYKSIGAFKQVINNVTDGRHEMFITRNIIKGVLINTNDDGNKIFYDCDLNNNTFCMWTRLSSRDIKSWIKPRNKLFNNYWLKFHRLHRLVIFTQNKYYVYQREAADCHGATDYQYYDNKCNNVHGQGQSNIIIFCYYNTMLRYQRLTNNMTRLYVLREFDTWNMTKYYTSLLFKDNSVILNKTVLGNNSVFGSDVFEAYIDNDKFHGITRSWMQVNTRMLNSLLRYTYIPKNAYIDNLVSICYNCQDDRHGISYSYEPCNNKSLHYKGNTIYSVNYQIGDEIRTTNCYDNQRCYRWFTEFKNGAVKTRTLYYNKSAIKQDDAIVTMYLGLYLLCRGNYVICHDDKVNRFLSYFDVLPPEIGELILSKLTTSKKIKINKTFCLIGANLLYPQMIF